MVTIFTPTYNRKVEMEVLYNSLLRQTNMNFEWLIVDDGSKDGTDKLVKKIMKDSNIKIRYFYKENGGKQSAYNVGLKQTKGDIFFCLDSDEILNENAIDIIINDFKNIDDDAAGFSYNRAYISDCDSVIGTRFPADVSKAYYYDIYGKLGVKGDKLMVFKSDIAKEYLFPEIEGEKFVPEALVFNRIAKKYKLHLSNEILSYTEYSNGGYSSDYFNLVKRNPKGNMLYFREVYDIKSSFYNVYGYLLFAFFAKCRFRDIIKNHPAKFKVLFLYIPVLVISWIRR